MVSCLNLVAAIIFRMALNLKDYLHRLSAENGELMSSKNNVDGRNEWV